MRTSRRDQAGFFLLLLAVFVAGMTGCGGGSPAAPPAIAVSITQGSSVSLDNGQTKNLTATVANDSSNAGVSWSLSGPGALSSQTTSSVTYTAPASGAATTATVTATSVSDATKSAGITIHISPVPSIAATPTPSAGTNGTAYSSFTVPESGGTAPLTWSISAGALPTGLSLNSSGTITGTPNANVNNSPYSFTVQVSDAVSVTATQAYSITINNPPAPSITTTSLPDGTVGTVYGGTIQATGGAAPFTWSVSAGTLPAGLSLGSSTTNSVMLAGTPTTQQADLQFTIRVQDSSNPIQSTSQPFTVYINGGALSVSITQGLSLAMDTGQTQDLTATVSNDAHSGGVTWSMTGPGALSNQTTTSATYTAPGSVPPATATVTATSVTDNTKSATITINITPPPSIAATPTPPTGTNGTVYSFTIPESGGAPPLAWSISIGALPTGLSLHQTGIISGTPNAPADQSPYLFTVQVTDAVSASATQAYSLTINNPAAPVISTSPLPPAGTNGTAYSSFTFTLASGGLAPFSWSKTGALPTGLSLSTGGVLSGTPTQAGVFPITVTVQDSSNPQQSASQVFSIQINNPPAPTISTTSLPDGTVGTAYNETIQATSGLAPFTWSVSVGTPPAGLSLGSSTSNSVTLSGTPTTAQADVHFTIQVKDHLNQTASQPYTVSIHVATCGTGNEAVLSGQYAFSLAGYNAGGFRAVVGSFTADGSGHITDGQADANSVALGPQDSLVNGSSSSYSVGADNRGCATIVTDFGTFTTRFALGGVSGTPATATEGRMIEWETGSSAYIAAGNIYKQQTPPFSALPSGSYVYGDTGVDSNPSPGRFATIGVLTVSGNNFTSGEGDNNDAGTPSHYTGMTGTCPEPNSKGRFPATTVVTGGGPTTNIWFYMVDATRLLYVTSDAPGTNVIVAGEMRRQTVPVGGFTNSSLNGKVVLYDTGLNGFNPGSKAVMGIANANGSTMDITLYIDSAGTWQTPQNLTSCSYAVASNGRMTLGCASPVFYLRAVNTGFYVSGDENIEVGQFEPQAAGPFTTGSLSGTFYIGTVEVVNQGAETGVGVATLTGGGVSGTNDYTSTTDQHPDHSGTDTITTVNSNGSFITAEHPTQVTGIIISSTKAVLVDNESSAYPTIQVIKQQ